jgi:transposase
MISMSRKARKRLEAFSRVKRGVMTLVEASEVLGLSYRQTKRAWSRYQSEGDAGLVHRLRGRAPNRHSPEKTKQQSLELYRDRYADYGATLAAECLEKEDGVKIPVTTLRRWLLQAGLLDRRRKRRVHRRRRTRREHLGELVQMDGSFHDWFEGRRGWAVLMVMIDDATGMVTARFYEKESRVVAKDWTWRWRNRILQLPRETAEYIRSGQRVTVCEPLDGALRVFAGEREVCWSPILAPPLPKRAKRTGPTGSSQGQEPAANHTWRGRRTAAGPSKPSAHLPSPAKKMAGFTSARCARLVEPPHFMIGEYSYSNGTFLLVDNSSKQWPPCENRSLSAIILRMVSRRTTNWGR